jgi:indole-3-glycerol phosphate synthase
VEQNFLDKIVAVKTKEVKQARLALPQDKITGMLRDLSPDITVRDFAAAINVPGKMCLIAEIKKASPSKGVLKEDFNPVKIARDYQTAGACALSVLTEAQFFGGNNSFIGSVKNAVKLPVLRKDFIIDEYQVYQSALLEADCILLIAEILDTKRIEDFLLTAKQLNMDVLVEANSDEALDKAVSSGAKLIGINNRDLNTFKVDIDTTRRLIKKIPKGKIIVSESGIRTAADVKMLESLGVNAVLIGETFMQAQDIPAKIREVMGW